MSGEIPVWVDGVKYDSSKEACDVFGFKPGSFKMGIQRGKFMGHVVSRCPPDDLIVKEEFVVKTRRSFDRLLIGEYCTHRLGVYHYQGV